jgi:lipopolysaccharide transport system permease protein
MLHALELYGQWFRRELSQRFAGAALGPLWLLLQPLSFIVIITLVFNGFFKATWPGGDGSALDYGLQVFIGLSVHTFTAEVLARSPGAILAQPYLVTKVRFPLPVLPAVVVGVALAQLMLTLCIALMLALVLRSTPMTTVLQWWALLPILVPAVLLMSGLALTLAAFGTYLRDLSNLMPAVASFLMFLMPVFYPAEFVPASLSWFIDWNPLAFTIESLRALVFRGELPSLVTWALHSLAGAGVAAAGLWSFTRVRTGFADML